MGLHTGLFRVVQAAWQIYEQVLLGALDVGDNKLAEVWGCWISGDSTSSHWLTINHVCVYVCINAGEPPTDRVAGKVL